MENPRILYKVLGKRGETYHGGKGSWFLPNGKRPGKWMPAVNTVSPCRSGYHLCEPEHLICWLGPTIWKAEWRGKIVRADNKIVVAQARLIEKVETWNDRTARLFACDCAEHVLHLYKNKYPDDSRLRSCIEMARWVATRDATWGAARAAWGAAWHAREAAASYAASHAASVAEKQWQTETLFKYLEN